MPSMAFCLASLTDRGRSPTDMALSTPEDSLSNRPQMKRARLFHFIHRVRSDIPLRVPVRSFLRRGGRFGSRWCLPLAHSEASTASKSSSTKSEHQIERLPRPDASLRPSHVPAFTTKHQNHPLRSPPAFQSPSSTQIVEIAVASLLSSPTTSLTPLPSSPHHPQPQEICYKPALPLPPSPPSLSLLNPPNLLFGSVSSAPASPFNYKTASEPSPTLPRSSSTVATSREPGTSWG